MADWVMAAFFAVQAGMVLRIAGKTKTGEWVDADDPKVDWIISLMIIAGLIMGAWRCVLHALELAK